MKLLYKVTFLFLISLQINAQILIDETFRDNRTSNDIVFGGNTQIVTSNSSSRDGWLRLTNTNNSQYGYAFINEAFNSTLGTVTEFEFKAWRDKQSNYSNGDGFTVFLFDGAIDKQSFRIGAYGGSLGYTKNSDVSPAVPNGLKGGYIAVGFDSYGGFGNNDEGKNGPSIPRDISSSSFTPNSIILRGATNESNPSQSNLILDYKKLGNRTQSIDRIRNNGELSYNVVTTTRPTDNQFYRKIKIEIIPEPSNEIRRYRIKVFLKKNINQDYPSTPEINYLTTQALPEMLKIGFAASTGGAINYHEIRNLKVSTLGNIGIISNADKNIICKESRSEEVTFKININNPESTLLSNLRIESKFLNSLNNEILDEETFKINSIEYSPEISNQTVRNNSNHLNASLNLKPSSIGTIIIKGTIKKPNIEIKSIVDVSSNLIDSDLSNNTSTEIIKRKICKVNTNPMLYLKPE